MTDEIILDRDPVPEPEPIVAALDAAGLSHLLANNEETYRAALLREALATCDDAPPTDPEAFEQAFIDLVRKSALLLKQLSASPDMELPDRGTRGFDAYVVQEALLDLLSGACYRLEYHHPQGANDDPRCLYSDGMHSAEEENDDEH
ncbi:hypothetical protein GS636_21460 [Ruegeria sp. HKCCD4884]|uniref:hypothetical protein n=1 Tax=Ruegeria sp. HKCCD4884 TaxID=2683022 RepID=UPI0014916F2C|nr:hypothetical protein [Ruegeria sp. HKCCD4884]NOD95374.1 hypothetical protein [Ruegeria sp. HKCCD4884]